MEYKLKIKKIKLDQTKRILCISDIHGGYNLIKELLDKVNFTNDDYLFIIGDIIEKGPESLKTLQYIMKLAKQDNVFVIIGNNDFALLDLFKDDFSFNYFNSLKNNKSIYHDFSNYYGINLDTPNNLEKIKELVKRDFIDEINFIYNLPTIIETDKLLFAHASITNYNNMINLDYHEVTKYDYFMRGAFHLPKKLIVGHYPSVAYCEKQCTLRPISNKTKNIVSIDGGYTAKIGGQLNCYIIENEKTLKESYDYVDDLTSVKVIKTDPGKPATIIGIWDREDFKVLEYGENYSICLINDVKATIPNDFVYYYKNKYYCADYTNEILSITENEIIKLVIEYDDYCFCKKDDVLGFVKKDNIIITPNK